MLFVHICVSTDKIPIFPAKLGGYVSLIFFAKPKGFCGEFWQLIGSFRLPAARIPAKKFVKLTIWTHLPLLTLPS